MVRTEAKMFTTSAGGIVGPGSTVRICDHVAIS